MTITLLKTLHRPIAYIQLWV